MRARRAAPLVALLIAACVHQSRVAPVVHPPEIDWRTLTGSPHTAADSLIVISHLRQAADSFVRVWRYNWEISDRYRYLAILNRPQAQPTFVGPSRGGSVPRFGVSSQTWGPPPGADTIALSSQDSLGVITNARGLAVSPYSRTTLLHCHPDGAPGTSYARIAAHIIESGDGKRAVCPNWYLWSAVLPWDERLSIDDGILDPLRRPIAAARTLLLAQLTRGSEQLPGDGWIAGQRLRFALDAKDTALARRAVSDCRAATWWCTALDGYAVHSRGEVLRADSIFQKSLQLMPPSEDRCRWTDLSILLEEDDEKEYSKVSCESRDSVNAKIWWLSDPLYSDSGNDRRAEHYARIVMVLLRSATTYNERWDMRRGGGGRATQEMLIRYGWPSFSYWSGRSGDVGHYGYLEISNPEMRDHGRFTTAEYSGPRFRLVPRMHAVTSPTQAWDSDWVLSARAHSDIHQGDAPSWWPREHYDRGNLMVQLWSQHGLFRRQDSILFAMATQLFAEDFSGATRDTLRGELFTWSNPQSMRVQRKTAVVGVANLIKSLVASEPQLVSLELHGARPAGVVARTRFGIEPPLPLSALQPGEVAVAPPVFIHPTTPDELQADNPESALARMYTNVGFRDPQVIGLYWETYGFGPRDSVVLSIRVERHQPRPGFVRRLGYALGLATRDRGTIAVEWREALPQRSMNIVSGAVPIQGRIVTLSMTQLQAGDYTMIVSAARPGGAAAIATRDFWLTR